MIVQRFVAGELLTNTYIVSCQSTKEAIIIDPGFHTLSEADKPFKFIEKNGLKVKLVVNTHGHVDHTCGNEIVKQKFNSPILIHEYDAHMLSNIGERAYKIFGFKASSPPADIILHDGESIKFGEENLKVTHTPGHTKGSISLIGGKEVFTGDTLFFGSIGRTDFPESSESDMHPSLRKLAALPEDFIVYPGHGPITTIGNEKRDNPFLQV